MTEDYEDFRAIVEGSPDAIFVVRAGRIAFVNPAAVQLTGHANAASLRDLPIVDLFDPGSRSPLKTCIDSARSSGRPAQADACITRPDGAVVHVAVAAARLGAPDESVVQVVLRDITERKADEAALRESEERLALAVAGARAGVWDWDLQSNSVVYSSRWKQMLGYSDEEIEPNLSAWERLVHPDDRHLADEAKAVLARAEQTYEVELRLRHKDGHYVYVLSRGYPVRSSDGTVVRVVGTMLDLTERKQVEAALRESEERLRLAFAGAQEGVWDWNLETGAVVYSSRWKEMLGYADDEIEPHVRAWERLLHPDDRRRAEQLNEDLARGGTTYEGEFRLRHKDGHYVHVLSRGYPLRREAGGPVVRIVGTHFDLTERKEAEKMQARRELLTRLVFAQEDERRRIAREMHDQFGEQLTTLARHIENLKRACHDRPDLSAHVEALEAVSQQIDRDVDHLVWQLRPTALDDLGLRAALANYVQDWSKRVGVNVRLHTSGLFDTRLPSEAETTLYRIAQEALTNVARHSRARNVEIILERRADQVLLVVEDDGVGFDLEKPKEGDGGFGLLGMQERAALVGATLEIESAPGRGTTILLRMTASESEAPTEHV